MKGLHTLKPAKNARQTKRRVGRGNASGKGTYAGRGMKGQRSRSGGKSGLVARSMRSYLLRIPKTRGFNRKSIVYSIVNLGEIQKHFEDGATVTPKKLRSKGLADLHPIKILSRGAISKKLSISAHKFSNSAKEAIEKAGGSIHVMNLKEPAKKQAPKKEVQKTEEKTS